MADSHFGICLNLPNAAASQYAEWNFNSMCKFGEVYLGANSSGIFSLGDADTDNATDIEALFDLPLVDLRMARVRSVHVGYEADGVVRLGVQADEGAMRYYQLSPLRASKSARVDGKQQTGKVVVGRGRRGRYWLFRMENVDGSDFSIDSMVVYPILTGHRKSNG
jgi:hypothetical protein